MQPVRRDAEMMKTHTAVFECWCVLVSVCLCYYQATSPALSSCYVSAGSGCTGQSEALLCTQLAGQGKLPSCWTSIT